MSTKNKNSKPAIIGNSTHNYEFIQKSLDLFQADSKQSSARRSEGAKLPKSILPSSFAVRSEALSQEPKVPQMISINGVASNSQNRKISVT